MNTRLRLRCPHRHFFVLLVASLLLLGTAVVPVASAARPLVRIVSAPSARTGDTEAVFLFKPAKATRTLCRIDRRRYRPCRRGRAKYTGVRPGRHIFRVRARRMGRVTVARRRWKVVPTRLGTPLPPPRGKLRFADEFNGTSLDHTNWSAWDSPGNGGIGLRRKSAFSVSNGNLVVTAKMVDGQIVSGGMAHRQDKIYGRYEFRVKTERDPTGSTSGVVMTWPRAQRSPEFTENDIYETGPTVDRDEFDTFIHYGRSHTTQRLFRHHVDATRWHTVAMDWRADSIKIYRDGVLVWNLTERAAIPDVLHHFGIQLDARHDRTLTTPVRMYVDYVRIYE